MPSRRSRSQTIKEINRMCVTRKYRPGVELLLNERITDIDPSVGLIKCFSVPTLDSMLPLT